ncbi:MAG: hypothetical protein M1570_18680 [Chloroflexi bacterium]|nr:hypothetical protein [Chloroflexota bacterium]
MIRRVLGLVFLLFALSACGSSALLDQVTLDPGAISPHAGSANAATMVHYTVTRSATVSIYLVDEQGHTHYFRKDQPRAAGSFDALFSGAIDDRVLPDGKYQFVVEAKDTASPQSEKVVKTLTITGADSTPPELRNFTVFPSTFTPNQDGINDRVTIRYFLTKPAKVDVYLTDGKNRYEVAEKKTTLAIKNDMSLPGAHEYDYDGGIDLGAEPPPDGKYTVVADAVDAVGNQVREEKPLTIEQGGVPRATIMNSGVDWSPHLVPLGSTLTFTVSVTNIGPVPVRTSGPEPGTVYRTDENFNSKKYYEQPGVWRVGLDMDGNSSGRPYPYRWQVGSSAELTHVKADNGQDLLYLMPGQRVTVTGTLQIVDKPPRINEYYWVGLIQEDVRIAEDHVQPLLVTVEY